MFTGTRYRSSKRTEGGTRINLHLDFTLVSVGWSVLPRRIRFYREMQPGRLRKEKASPTRANGRSSREKTATEPPHPLPKWVLKLRTNYQVGGIEGHAHDAIVECLSIGGHGARTAWRIVVELGTTEAWDQMRAGETWATRRDEMSAGTSSTCERRTERAHDRSWTKRAGSLPKAWMPLNTCAATAKGKAHWRYECAAQDEMPFKRGHECRHRAPRGNEVNENLCYTPCTRMHLGRRYKCFSNKSQFRTKTTGLLKLTPQ